MKIMSRIAWGMLATLTLASANALASPRFLSVTSPDHPQTWVVGANQQAKSLRWDSSRHMLVVDVKYSTQDYADSANPTQIDYHTLAFPNVRLASNGSDLLASNHASETARIGHISNGLFGKRIVLNNNVNLNVHRMHGKIYASLVYNALADD